MDLKRRDFLSFLGRSVAASSVLNFSPLSFAQEGKTESFKFTPILPSDEDRLILSEGFQARLLMGWGDKISRTEHFGFNNDYIGFIPDSKNSGHMWVNHESPNPLFINKGQTEKTKDHIIEQQKSVGGSVLRIRKENNNWNVVKNHPHNFRLDGTSRIPFSGGISIAGSTHAIGTFGNCGGGVTPWGTFLTCEENYDQYYGEIVNGNLNESACQYDWQKFFKRPPQHYGWVVEVNPLTKQAKKLVSMGRFAHEAALVVPASNNRVVVYMGDDANDQHVYKFISSKKGNLETGDLYVANTEKGEWLLLNKNKNEKLRQFIDHTDLMVNTREAAKILGATPLDRPEDIERDPLTGSIIVSLTNNKPKGRPHGSLFKITEANNDPTSLHFESSYLILGGEETGFSCPDNLTFDRNGNLWIAADISGSEMNKGHYTKFKNNGLFVIPARGPRAGKVLQVASAPRDAEFTGPCFSPDYQTLFLSVQHPGETTKDYSNPTSHWPDGKNKIPRSCVVAITGAGLSSIV